MECNLIDEQPLFTIIIGNVKMKYPLTPILKICPNWRSTILNEGKLELDENIDLNGVQSFFEGIINHKIQIKEENCQTILKLGESCGSQKIIEDARSFINTNQRTIPELIEEIIQQNQEENNQFDQHSKEIYLSKHYNEILRYPELLQKVELSQHYRIVKKALNYYNKNEFNYRGFISFVIDLIQKDSGRKYSMLLSLLKLDDFEIKEIEKLCNCKNFDENVLDYKIVNFISKIKENTEKIEKHDECIKNIQFQLNETKEINKKFINEIELKLSNFINEFSQQNKMLFNDNLSKMNQQEIQTIDEKLTSLKRDLHNEIENNQNQNKKLIENQYSKLSNAISNQQSLLNNISIPMFNEKLESFHSYMKKEIENSQNQNKQQSEELMKIIKQQSEEINQQSKKQSEEIKHQNKQQNEDMIKLIKQQNEDMIKLIKQQNEDMIKLIKQQNDKIKQQNEEMLKCIKQQSEEIRQQNKQQNEELKQHNKQLFDEKFLSFKLELKNEIENDQKLNKQSINDQSSRIGKLFTNQLNSINDIKQHNKQLLDEKLASYGLQLKNEIGKFQSIQIGCNQIKTEMNEFKSLNIMNIIEFIPYESYSNRFKGIITKLGNGNPMNALDYKIINITSSSTHDSSESKYDFYLPMNVLYYEDSRKTFNSKDEPNAWLCIDFVKHRVNVTHYSLKSNGHGEIGHYHLKSWNIEGSNDNKNWEILDVRRDDWSLNDRAASNTFEVGNKTINNQYYRYLKIQQKDLNRGFNNWLSLSAIEFYGSLINTLHL